MSRSPSRRVGAALLAFAALILPLISTTPISAIGSSGLNRESAEHRSGALATFDVAGERFRLWVTNPQTVIQLISLRDGTSEAHIPNGRILRGRGYRGYNK